MDTHTRYVRRYNANRLHIKPKEDPTTYCGQKSQGGAFREVPDPGFYAFERLCYRCAGEDSRRRAAERAATVEWAEQAPHRWTHTDDHGTYVLEQAGDVWLLTWPLSSYEAENGLGPEVDEHSTRESASAAVGDL